MADKRYTKNGEWIRRDPQGWTIGLSASAAAELGDVTFVEAPREGLKVAAGEAVCALEAVKAAADFYSPVDGTVTGFNTKLETEPQLVSTSPEDAGWIATLTDVDVQAFEALLDESGWKAWEAAH